MEAKDDSASDANLVSLRSEIHPLIWICWAIPSVRLIFPVSPRCEEGLNCVFFSGNLVPRVSHLNAWGVKMRDPGNEVAFLACCRNFAIYSECYQARL